MIYPRDHTLDTDVWAPSCPLFWVGHHWATKDALKVFNEPDGDEGEGEISPGEGCGD
jgi:hypothetical protein